MNKKQIIEKLVKIANSLDELSLIDESDKITRVAESVSEKSDPVFNPDYLADDLEAQSLDMPEPGFNPEPDDEDEDNSMLRAIKSLIAAHKSGKLTDDELADALTDFVSGSNTKEFALESDDDDHDIDPNYPDLDYDPNDTTEDDFLVDGKFPDTEPGDPSFDDLMQEGRNLYRTKTREM